MRYFILFVFSGFLLIGFNANAEQEGKEIFDSLHCAMCHKPDTGTLIPSLKEISAIYKGKEGQLLNYFKGEVESIINPAKRETMKRYIEKTKELKAEDRKTLADFILSH